LESPAASEGLLFSSSPSLSDDGEPLIDLVASSPPCVSLVVLDVASAKGFSSSSVT